MSMIRHMMINTTDKTQQQKKLTIDFSRQIGKGGFGKVYLGAVNETDEVCAVKIVNVTDSRYLTRYRREIDIMYKLSTPQAVNIVSMYGYRSNDSMVTIAMTYVENGTLQSWLDEQRELYFNPQFQMKLMHGVACGLAYIHASNVLHCDIKPGNVLVDKNMNPYICDFGASKESGIDDLYAVVGTRFYMAPEILLMMNGYMGSDYFTDKSDIYSFSLLCWCVVTQSSDPYDCLDNKNSTDLLIQTVVHNQQRDEIPSTCPPKVAEFIRLGWDASPKNRPTAKQAVEMLAEAMEQPVQSPGYESMSCFACFFQESIVVVPNVDYEAKVLMHTKAFL